MKKVKGSTRKKSKGYDYAKHLKAHSRPASQQQRGKQQDKLKGLDQEMLQKIAAEGGVEALQDYLATSGSGAQVMTAESLMKKKAELEKLKKEYEL